MEQVVLFSCGLHVAEKRQYESFFFFLQVKSVVHFHQNTKCLVAALHSGLLMLHGRQQISARVIFDHHLKGPK